MTFTRSERKVLTFAFGVAAIGFLVSKYLENTPTTTVTMPSNDELFHFGINDDLTLADVHNMRRVASLHNFDPIAMTEAVVRQVYGYCLNQTSDQISLAEISKSNNRLDAIDTIKSVELNLVSGANITWTVPEHVYKTQTYVDWYNQLDSGINERLCNSVLFIEFKRLFTRFVELAGKMLTDEAILAKMQPENAAYHETVAERSAIGFAGTVYESTMNLLDQFVKSMVKLAPAGVDLSIETHNYPAPKL
jgi:hypothetical protein